MENIPRKEDNPDGLHQRYIIFKIFGEYKKPVDENAEYFVMRLYEGGSDIEHIKACRIGIHAYAEAIKKHLPKLAKDLIKRYPLL